MHFCLWSHICSLLVTIYFSPSQSQYMFGSERLTWYSARDWCRSTGSELISVHSGQSLYHLIDALNSHLNNTSILSHWIGLYRDGSNPTDSSLYQWSDSSPFDYGSNVSGGLFPWKSVGGINPNSQINPSCVRLQNNADPQWAWDDIDCNATNSGLQAIPICFSSLQSHPTMNPSVLAVAPITTSSPTMEPIFDSITPTFSPSVNPSVGPTLEPSLEPTVDSQSFDDDISSDPDHPTTVPTIIPTMIPTAIPSAAPTAIPLEFNISPLNTLMRSTSALPEDTLSSFTNSTNPTGDENANSNSSHFNLLSLMNEHYQECIVLTLLFVTLCATCFFVVLIMRTNIIVVVPLSRAHEHSSHPHFESIKSGDSCIDHFDHDF